MVNYLDREGTSHLITKLLNTMYPVNSIYISLNSISPASLYGGTWERFGNGKTLVGVDESDTDFSSANKTGGEKAHTIIANELPEHYHPFPAYSSGDTNYEPNFAIDGWRYSGQYHTSDGWHRREGHTYNNETLNTPMNIVQPYVTVYIWKRVR